MFTIGMATYDDFDGVYFTVQALRLYGHQDHINEIIVVDNNPNGKYARSLAAFCASTGTRYIPLPAPVGTSPPRNAVFDNAKSDYVVCVDSHVLLMPDCLQHLAAYYADRPFSRDLLHGPMYYDPLDGSQENCFVDRWSAEMWGQWGCAWVDPEGFGVSPRYVIPRVEDGRTKYLDVMQNEFDHGGPEIDWSKPIDELMRHGYRRPTKPFDIPAMGMGMFACRKDGWLRFNEQFRGFGGEEFYIHRKYQQAGRRVLCIPGAGWVHRFGRPSGTPYPLDKWDKYRNYVIGMRELGIDTAPARAHFLSVGLPPQYADMIEADPVNCVHPERNKPCGSCGGPTVTQTMTLQDAYQRAADTPSDFNEHVPTLRDLASRCKHVTEFGVRHGVSTVALLHAQPARLVSYDVTRYPEVSALEQMRGNAEFIFVQGSSLDVDIEPTDMLFIDTKHTAAQLTGELEKHHGKVARYIVMHDTVTFGQVGEDGSPGLLAAIVPFIAAHPEWTVIKHYPNNHGLMVLSKSEEDKQELPSMWRQAINYSKALAKDVAAGRKRVSLEIASARMMECALCDQHNGGKCAKCGCPVAEKTQWRQEQCPLNKW